MRNRDIFSQAKVVGAEYDEGLRSYMLGIYNYMGSALAVTGLIAYLVANTQVLAQAIFGTGLAWVVALAPLGVVFYLSARLNKMSLRAAQTWFWAFAGLMGLSMASIFLMYTGESVARVFFITAGAFAGMSLYGYTTKKDLSGMGSFLFMGLIGIILASIVNIFIGSSGLQFAISVIGVLVFTGLTAYDTQRLKHSYYTMPASMQGHASIMGALQLYLDFINLFIMLMHLLGDRR